VPRVFTLVRQPLTAAGPTLGAAAYHGPAGEFTRAIDRWSEASPAAILIQCLVALGNAVGRRAHFTAGSDVHHMNEFGVIVGDTAKARKGMSLSFVLDLMRVTNAEWANDCVKSGLASGEGLIAALQNRSDKRLLLVEPEFSRVLKTAERSGNVLSDVLRQAWDGGNLDVLTRNSPLHVQAPHVSVLAHITLDELRELLTDITTLNGFANRFLWVHASRHKLLPDGERPDAGVMSSFAGQMRSALEFGQTRELITRTKQATELWRSIYPSVSIGHRGLFGAATARAEPHIMRLACIYALLDHEISVSADHLHAALTVWHYCEDTAQLLFRDAPVNPLEGRILAALRGKENGLTRTELSAVFSHNQSTARISGALESLQSQGRIREVAGSGGRGRPVEHWVACDIKGV